MRRFLPLFATGLTTFVAGIALGAAVMASTTPTQALPVTGHASKACADARAMAREVLVRSASNPDYRAGDMARDAADKAAAAACS